MAMDACHLLMGRLRQYDRNIVHDEKRNSYSFISNNIKIVLLPSKELTKIVLLLNKKLTLK